jgi:4,5-dihydroxyphthalate decarboxylase
MLREAAAASSSPKLMPERQRIGRSLYLIIGYCVQQGLIPRAYDVEELFDDVTRPLFDGMP